VSAALQPNSANLMKMVDQTTRLAGSNRFEILLFTIASENHGGNKPEVLGINVFKVREVVKLEDNMITGLPGAPAGVVGVVSLRGNIIPAVDVCHFIYGTAPQNDYPLMLITEFGGMIQGFLARSVERIIVANWEQVVPCSAMFGAGGSDGFMTGMLSLKEYMVSILDAEKIMASYTTLGRDLTTNSDASNTFPDKTVIYADDSTVARRQIESVLKSLDVKIIACENGAQALASLKAIAARVGAGTSTLKEEAAVLLTDIEMPEMDGYVLTRAVKQDPILKDLPVILYSSLSSDAIKSVGFNVGADAYVAKFESDSLVNALLPFLKR